MAVVYKSTDSEQRSSRYSSHFIVIKPQLKLEAGRVINHSDLEEKSFF